jgi:hypothetical protein
VVMIVIMIVLVFLSSFDVRPCHIGLFIEWLSDLIRGSVLIGVAIEDMIVLSHIYE